MINAMLEDGKITSTEAEDARSSPISLRLQHDPNSLAPYFVEEIRRYLESKYGTDQVHEGGLKVYTSLDVDLQKAANQAVLDGLAAYERRHGWKGHLENVLAEGKRDRQIRASRLGRRTGSEWICARAGDFLWDWNCNAKVRAICGGSGTGGCGVDTGKDTKFAAHWRYLLREDFIVEP